MPIRVDPWPHTPELYPDFARREFSVPTRSTFEHAIQFATLRVFTLKEKRLVDWEADLDLYTKHFDLGRVVWPLIDTIFAENFDDLVHAIKNRDLWLFDLWGHVPGSAPEGMWAHLVPPAGMVAWLRKTLGDRFLGFDNGEQDGRYIGLYATQQCPLPQDGLGNYFNFHRHFRRLGDDMGNQLSVLTSLQFIHHFAREGNHLLLGAETAQALPNSQVYYSFIRGAGKQYGLLWFGNASIFNRWGYKSYDGEGESYGLQFGPEHGTSLALLRRLLYSHILYGCSIVGFENNWVLGDDSAKRLRGESVLTAADGSLRLSPIGKIQAAAVQWTRQYGNPGTMLTPIGLLLDVFSGWTVPRHLYVPAVYQTWGAMPYNDGDHLTHGLFSMLYPGYEDAGYFRDERGFMSPTPFGDIADTLLTDAPPALLHRYATIICAGSLKPTEELRDSLEEYLCKGGCLVLTSHNAALLLRNMQWAGHQTIAAGWVDMESSEGLEESNPFEIALPEDLTSWHVVARAGDIPVAISRRHGMGKLLILLSPYGLVDAAPNPTCRNETETSLPMLRPLLKHVHYILKRVLAENQLVTAGPDLATIVCRNMDSNRYTVGVFNHSLEPKPLQLSSRLGTVIELQEQTIPADGVGERGYLPIGQGLREPPRLADPDIISAGDVRIFSLQIEDAPHVSLLQPVTTDVRPNNRFINLRGHHNITETLLSWPTFFRHFDGIKIDWNYLRDRDFNAVSFEGEWIQRQSLRLLVDFSSGLNFYPDLTLLDTFEPRYDQSMRAIEDILRKAAVAGAEGIVLSLHRIPENHCDADRAAARFLAGTKCIVERAREHLGPTAICYLSHHPAKWLPTLDTVVPFVSAVGDGMRVAWQLGHESADRLQTATTPDPHIGMILAAGSTTDALGQWYDTHAPARRLPITDWQPLISKRIPIVLDSVYPTWDEAYLDLRAVFHSFASVNEVNPSPKD